MPAPLLFPRIHALPTLQAAFEKVRGNGGGPGGDGMRVETFAERLDLRLARLSGEIEQGFYRPGPLRRVAIPKRGGGQRRLAIPCVVDRVAQSAAAAVLGPRLEAEFSPASFAYRPGRSAKQAVARVAALRRQGYCWVVDADIAAFFDEVPHAPLLARLAALAPEPPLIDLVELWLESFDADGIGLAQGAPISPLLANLHLDALDDAFENGPVRIVRFADDFVLLAKSRGGAEAALARALAALEAAGLRLNREKTRIIPFEDAFRFLGHLFVRSVVLEAQEDAAPVAARAAAHALTPSAPFGPPPEDDLPEPPEDLSEDAPEDAPAPGTARLLRRAARVEDPLAPLAEDRDADDLAIGRGPLYLLADDARLEAEGETLAVFRDGARVLALPPALVSRIDLSPEARFSDAALRLCAAHGVPTFLLDGLGGTAAVLTPANGDDAGLVLAQAAAALDPERRLALARAFVAGRLRNAGALLRRLNRRRADPASAAVCERLGRLRRKAAHARDLDAVRGVEGEGASLYWPALGATLLHGFRLVRRRAESGREPAHAVLDLTAWLLAREVRAAATRAGLHPGIGALHATADGREGCVSDLMEAFRAPLAEGLSVYLFNNRILRAEDFRDTPEGARLAPGATRKAIEAFESWLARPVKDPRAGRRTTWRGLVLAETRAYATALRQGADFAPYALDF